jgi:hypothetical protein
MPTLTVKSGPAAGRSLPIEGDVVIGREAADLTIEDQELSRRHVVIRPAGGGVQIEDLGSMNGTIVNGRRIDAPVTITTGAIVEVGGTRIAIELAQPDTTRVAGQPVAAVDQPTRAREVAPPPPPPKPPAEPPPEAAPAAPGGGPQRPAAKSRLLIAAAVLLALAVIGAAVVLLLGGDDEETTARTLDGTVSTLPLGDPTSFQVSGVLDGEPLEDAAVVIQRRFARPPERGGRAVPVRGFMLFTPPGGTFSLNFNGTLRLTRSGGEQLRASGTAGNGLRDFEGMKGTFRMSGGRSSSRSGTARYRLTGKLDY